MAYFQQAMPDPKTELDYDGSPFRLLVAVILSAQCTDKRVNLVTPALFEAFPTPETLAAATEEQVYELIRSVSYPNNKTRSLIGMARRLVDECGGEVPSDIDNTRHIPSDIIPKAHHWLILHGRYVCKARRPDCLNCGLTSLCRHYSRTSRSPQAPTPA